VPNAVPEGPGTNNLQPLGIAGQSAELWLVPPDSKTEAKAPTSVSLSEQGLVQVLEAAVTGLEPGKPYLLALASEPSGTGVLEPLQGFMTNPAGAAVVSAIGPIRQLVRGGDKGSRATLSFFPALPRPTGPPSNPERIGPGEPARSGSPLLLLILSFLIESSGDCGTSIVSNKTITCFCWNRKPVRPIPSNTGG
jgi:hypothetical protein